jgi:hypothetical protein
MCCILITPMAGCAVPELADLYVCGRRVMPDRGMVPAGVRGLGQHGAYRPVAGLGDVPAAAGLPLEYSLGTRPVNPMHASAVANLRQSITSVARVSADGSAIPR